MHDAATTGVVVLAWVSLTIWLVLVAGRGWFWRVSALQATAGMRPLERCRVVAIIPARDEADVIGEAVGSLLKQEFDGDLEVIVVDDNSSDGTSAMVQGARVIPGAALASGWTGKLWAMQQGVDAAPEADFFLFTDADIRHDAWNVASLVGMAQANKLDLVSHMVKLHCGTWAEKFTIPAFVFFFFKLYPPSWIASEKSKTAGAAGGCVLIRPAALSRIGGLAAIRGEVIDDCSLARAVKRNGGRLWLGLTATTESIRPYAGLGEIGRMISRSAFRQLDHSVLLLAGSVFGLLVTYAAPSVTGNWWKLCGPDSLGFDDDLLLTDGLVLWVESDMESVSSTDGLFLSRSYGAFSGELLDGPWWRVERPDAGLSPLACVRDRYIRRRWFWLAL